MHLTEDSMVAFFYELMRDHVPMGVIEEIVKDQERFTKEEPNLVWQLSNKHLANYAEEIVARLQSRDSS